MKSQKLLQIKNLLESELEKFDSESFITNDPVSIPHRFTEKQDIEIAGFFAALFAWGNRKIILNKCDRLLELMDNDPSGFILNHQKKDLKQFEGYAHRTFNSTDICGLVGFLQRYYSKHGSFEDAFYNRMTSQNETIELGLVGFKGLFEDDLRFPRRSLKHIASPVKNSACKRLNMFLRWMIRKDENGVDFGIWQKIKPSQLVCPLDVRVFRNASKLGLVDNKTPNWKSAVQLTRILKQFDEGDPVKYDVVLFGLT